MTYHIFKLAEEAAQQAELAEGQAYINFLYTRTPEALAEYRCLKVAANIAVTEADNAFATYVNG